MFKYTEKRLAKDIGRVAESIDPSLAYSYLPESNEVKLASTEDVAGGPFTIFLGNLYLKVADLPRKDRLPAIEAFLREVLTPKELSPDELMDSLTVRVRTDFEIDFRNRHIELMGHEAPPSIWRRRGELLLEVVSDRDESVSVARSDDLAEIDVSEDDAMRIAAARIRRSTSDDQWEKVDESVWMSVYQDDYDFARLLVAEELPSFPFNGKPIVFAPSHSICLVTDSVDADVLSRMTEIGNENAAAHRPFSQLLWTTVEGGDWKEWQPDPESQSSGVSRLQNLRETAKMYEEVHDYLERSLGEDVFVASFQAMQTDEGLTSYCVYTFDLPSYLPESDFVAVVDPALPEEQTVVGRVDWAEYLECLGEGVIQRAEGLEPPWYTIMQTLTADKKDRLRQLAKPL